MWNHAEVVGLLDSAGRVCAVSRNEDEAVIKRLVGIDIRRVLAPESHDTFEAEFQAALDGEEPTTLLAGLGDDSSTVWGRVHLKRSPEPADHVLFHVRRLPQAWSRLTAREKAVVEVLNGADMNSKRAAKTLGISVHTLNSHRRAVCNKCDLNGVGEFWVFVEHCR